MIFYLPYRLLFNCSNENSMLINFSKTHFFHPSFRPNNSAIYQLPFKSTQIFLFSFLNIMGVMSSSKYFMKESHFHFCYNHFKELGYIHGFHKYFSSFLPLSSCRDLISHFSSVQILNNASIFEYSKSYIYLTDQL